MKRIIGAALMLFSALGFSAENTISGAVVTAVRAYETHDGSTRAFIAVNGQGRVGPNPDAPSVNCQLWTYTNQVLGLALAAKTSGQKVNITYVSTTAGDEFCNVYSFEISG
ncbi:MAG: hypothetical protein V4812_18635 [Pseudomonadota bacterium]